MSLTIAQLPSFDPAQAEDGLLEVCLGHLPAVVPVQRMATDILLDVVFSIHRGRIEPAQQRPKEIPAGVEAAGYVVRRDGRRWLCVLIWMRDDDAGENHLHILHGPDRIVEAAMVERMQQGQKVN